MQTVKFKVRRDGRLWHGEVTLPFGPERFAGSAVAPRQQIRVQAQSGSKSDALAKAAGIAGQIVNNPLVAAALPPGSGAAVKALQLLGKSGAAEGMKKLMGAGASRIADALKFW